jgi:glutathione S-transferase
MLRIHGSPRSRAVRTLWMAGELGLSYEHNDILPRSPGTRTPEYLALNPNARVPTIEDGDFVLSESMAINMYLAKKHNSPLYPKDPRNEARMWQWSLWETDRLDRQITTYAGRRLRLGRDCAGVRRPERRAGQSALAGRRRFQHRRPERRRRAVPRPVDRPDPLAGVGRVAGPLLGPPGGEEGPSDAGGVIVTRPPACG